MTEPTVEQDKPVEAPGDSSEATPTEDKSPAELAALKEQLEQVQKSYQELRSHTDRTSGENAALKKLLEQQEQQQRLLAAEKANQSQEEFMKEWREKVQEDPSAALDFYQGAASELKNELSSSVKKELEELKALIDPIRNTLEERDPEYLNYKDTVDKLMSEAGLDRKQALAVAKLQQPSVSHAGATPAPGATGSIQAAKDGGESLDLAGAEAYMIKHGSADRYQMLGGTIGDDRWKEKVAQMAKDLKEGVEVV